MIPERSPRDARVLVLLSCLVIQACASAAPPTQPSSPPPSPAPRTQAALSPAPDPVMEQFVDSVLAGLTLEEKLGQLA